MFCCSNKYIGMIMLSFWFTATFSVQYLNKQAALGHWITEWGIKLCRRNFKTLVLVSFSEFGVSVLVWSLCTRVHYAHPKNKLTNQTPEPHGSTGKPHATLSKHKKNKQKHPKRAKSKFSGEAQWDNRAASIIFLKLGMEALKCSVWVPRLLSQKVYPSRVFAFANLSL